MKKKENQVGKLVKRIMAVGLAVCLTFASVSLQVTAVEVPLDNANLPVTEQTVPEPTGTESTMTEPTETELTATELTVTETEPTVTEDEVIEEETADADKARDASATLQVATELKWNKDKPGEAKFYNPNESKVAFWVQFYQDGKKRGSSFMVPDGPDKFVKGPGYVTCPIYRAISDPANYTYQVTTYRYDEQGYIDYNSSCISGQSEGFDYKKPKNQLSEPINIKWDTTQGSVSWSSVENAEGYYIYLNYKRGVEDIWERRFEENLLCNWQDIISKEKCDDYDVYVEALSKNIDQFVNSNKSGPVSFEGDKVNNGLETAIGSGEITGDNAVEIKNRVKEVFANKVEEFRSAMEKYEKIRKTIETFEVEYMKAKKVSVPPATVAEGTGVSNVSLLGAGLNATAEGAVTFNVKEPSETTIKEELIKRSNLTNAIVLNLELSGAGINSGATLEIPVTVTLELPKNINLSRLEIQHYGTDNSPNETFRVRDNGVRDNGIRVNENGTISFTVTHFSNFVFGEYVPESNNSSGSSSGGSSNSTSKQAPKYKIISNTSAVWALGSEGSFLLYGDGDFAKFVGVMVDGVPLDKAYYDASAGSTVIALKGVYLNTLSAGNHSVTIVWTDGAAETVFAVAGSALNNNAQKTSSKDSEPKTGDSTLVEIYATLAMVSGLAYLRLCFADFTIGMSEETKKELVDRLIRWAKRGGKLRKFAALAVIFVLLVYYHGIGKKVQVKWNEAYES